MKEKCGASCASSLGNRLKGYEADYESHIDNNKHIIVRLDGHKFSKFAKDFKKPYDKILSDAMVATATDLLEEFQAYTAYTQSDEITLVIPSPLSLGREDGHILGGRVQKITSLAAGFATMKFNAHLKRIAGEAMYNGADREWIEYSGTIMFEKAGTAWFDARVYGIEEKSEAFNSVMWRVRDAVKNSKAMFAQSLANHKELHGKTSQEQIEYVQEKTGKFWGDMPGAFKYGTLIKKEQYEKFIPASEHAPDQFVTRSRIKTWSAPITTYFPADVDMVCRKYH